MSLNIVTRVSLFVHTLKSTQMGCHPWAEGGADVGHPAVLPDAVLVRGPFQEAGVLSPVGLLWGEARGHGDGAGVRVGLGGVGNLGEEDHSICVLCWQDIDALPLLLATASG